MIDVNKIVMRNFKLLILIFGFFAIAFILVNLYGYFKEDKAMLLGEWDLISVVEEEKESIDDYFIQEVVFFSVSQSDLVYTPRKKSDDLLSMIIEADWQFFNSGFLDGQIMITNSQEVEFNGVFEIDVLHRSFPKILRFYNNEIQFVISEK